jgi:catechol 2,3-dioxygenase-like lactoylglutathione lyase family enzyme
MQRIDISFHRPGLLLCRFGIDIAGQPLDTQKADDATPDLSEVCTAAAAVFLTGRRPGVSNLRQVTPFLTVPDMEAALGFFSGVLSFETRYREANYAYIERENVAFRLLEDGEPPKGDRRYAYYIDVDDVDRLYSELKPKLDTLPPGDVTGPVNQEYGQREFMVVAPDGDLIVFGQGIRRPASQE